MSDNTAILAGYTEEVFAVNGMYDLHLWVKPDADLEGRFKAYDADECEWLWVNGWLFTIEPVNPASEGWAVSPAPLGWQFAETDTPQ